MVIGSWATVSFQGFLVMQSRVPDDLVSSFTEKIEPIACECADLYDAPGLCALIPTTHLFFREERSSHSLDVRTDAFHYLYIS